MSNTNDSGPGSLRQAIADAAPTESIIVPAGVYKLTTGELRIANSLTITGAGSASTIIQAGDQSRVFQTNGQASDITIAGVTISDGETHPAPGAQLALGGGVVNDDATLTLAHDVIKDSIADADGDGAAGAGGTAYGGGVYSALDGTLHLLDTQIRSNSASAVGSSGHGGGTASGGGAKIIGSFTIAGTTFEDNRADARGGQGPSNAGQSGGFSFGGGLEAEPPGAGSQLSSSTLDANVADASPGPGGPDGLAAGAGTFLESDTSPLTATDVTITGNVARGTSGTADDGGGIYFAGTGQVLTLTNSTLSANSTNGPGGNIYEDNGTIAMQNTIVSAGVAYPGSENCASPAISLGHNLDSHDQCGFHAAGDLINRDPVLGPLEDNGGPVQTMALQPSSPAIDAGGANACPAVDARGVLRPAGAACDIGAFELAKPAATTGQASTIATGSAVISGVASNPDLGGANAVFQYGTTTAYGESTPGQPVSATTAAVRLSAPLTGLAPVTTYHFRIVVTNAAGSVTGTDQTFTTSHPAPGASAPARTPAPALPRIAKLKITPAALSLNQRATVSYTDTQAARTAFTLQRPMPGRLDGRACSAATKRNQRHRHCVRWVNAGATVLTHADAPGSNHFLFAARQIARKLALGQYRLRATPRAHGLAGRALTTKLRINAPSGQHPHKSTSPHGAHKLRGEADAAPRR